MTPLEYAMMAAGASLLSWILLREVGPFIGKRLEKTADRHARDLREEFLLMPPRRIVLILAASGCLLASVSFIITAKPALAAAGGAAPMLLSGWLVKFYRTRRRTKVISQLPGFLDVMAGQIKAGRSVQEALSDTIPLLPTEIRNEISWIFRLCKLGTPLPEAFLLWEERMPCDEVSLLVRPLRAALPAGGNVVELLVRTRDILGARNRMKEKMRSMTAQARLQAAVLTFLPPAFAFALSRIDPSFLPRALGTAQGRAILAAAAFLQLLGWLTIRKILSVKP